MSVTESRPFATNNFKYKYARNLAFGSFAVFLLGGALMLQPFSIADNSYADSKNTAISLKIGESIMVPEVSTDSINIELDPTAADGDFKTASVTVGVSTNRTAGYTLTASVEGSETALTNADYDNYEIAALGGKTAAATFADLDDSGSMNKWGYATDNNGEGDGQTEAGYYYAMPGADNPTTLKITNGPAATSNTEVTFATKGKDLAAGKYENTVVFTAIGNLEPILTMQDFTTEQCNALTEWGGDGSEGDTISLIDSRDDNEYIIRKLADGNCWMVQNLRLAGRTITASDSDIVTDFILPESSTSGFNNYNSSYVYVDNTNDKYGGYYSWYAATAGTGTQSVSNSSVNPSICPKGWKLPSGPTFSSSDQFQNLYTAYDSDSTNFENATNTGSDYWAGFYWSSSYYTGSGSAASGGWWSRTASDDSSAYMLHVDGSSGVYISYRDQKLRGYNVRCVLVGS